MSLCCLFGRKRKKTAFSSTVEEEELKDKAVTMGEDEEHGEPRAQEDAEEPKDFKNGNIIRLPRAIGEEGQEEKERINKPTDSNKDKSRQGLRNGASDDRAELKQKTVIPYLNLVKVPVDVLEPEIQISPRLLKGTSGFTVRYNDLEKINSMDQNSSMDIAFKAIWKSKKQEEEHYFVMMKDFSFSVNFEDEEKQRIMIR